MRLLLRRVRLGRGMEEITDGVDGARGDEILVGCMRNSEIDQARQLKVQAERGS